MKPKGETVDAYIFRLLMSNGGSNNGLHLAGYQVDNVGLFDEAGNIVGHGEMEVQMRQASTNIQKLLAMYGATIENIVDEILLVTDMDGAFAAAVKCRQEIFSGTPVIARTLFLSPSTPSLRYLTNQSGAHVLRL